MVCKIIPTASDCLSSWNWTESSKCTLMVMKVTNQKKECMKKGSEQKRAKAIALHSCSNESYNLTNASGKKWHLMN